MNSIPGVFHDSHEVMQAYRDFYDYAELPLANKDELIANEKMIKIYTAIFEHLGIEENVDEVTLLRYLMLLPIKYINLKMWYSSFQT